jgi:retron-type reverse transcriptase
MYVERWLKAPMQKADGELTRRTRGTPQGGPISPLIANVFLHYGFDVWMTREYPGISFERFADDAVVHCVTERQARRIREAIGQRLADIGLELLRDKTRISSIARTATGAWTTTGCHSRSADTRSVPGRHTTTARGRHTRASSRRSIRGS